MTHKWTKRGTGAARPGHRPSQIGGGLQDDAVDGGEADSQGRSKPGRLLKQILVESGIQPARAPAPCANCVVQRAYPGRLRQILRVTRCRGG